jgi:hypothetical protein
MNKAFLLIQQKSSICGIKYHILGFLENQLSTYSAILYLAIWNKL